MIQDIRLIAEKIIRQYAFLILREQSLNYFLWNNQKKILMKIIHQKGMDFLELHQLTMLNIEDVETVIALVRKAGGKIVKEPQEVFWGGYSKGLKLANKYVKKTGNKNAQMYFSVDNPKEFAKYTNTKLLEVDGFFQKALKDCHGLKLSTKIYMYFADRWNRTLVVHLRFTE